MPSSNPSQLSAIVQAISLTNPQSLLDVGVGFGKYGFLAREYLELWDGREKYSDWTRRIDGIEAQPAYITPMHRLIYSNIFEGNALDVIPGLDYHYDLAILIDVLEHFERSEGTVLLHELAAKANNVLISTPKHPAHQEAAFGNPFERHVSQWSPADFVTLGRLTVIPNPDSLIVFAGDQTAHVSREMLRTGPAGGAKSLRSLIARRAPFLRRPYRVIKERLS